jgi:ADP-heptose:LPS heptosyltransferase
MPDAAKPRLLVVELWGMGDLLIATPFLQAASQSYRVTLLAKPYAHDLQRRFWPEVRITTFQAPWTAFRGKYRLHRWPWRDIFRLKHLAEKPIDVGLSARWDPRDHLLLRLVGARKRLGFPRLKSDVFLNQPLARPAPDAHRYESWRVLGESLNLALPPREKLPFQAAGRSRKILVHTGAGQPVRVWPLGRYRALVEHLRRGGHEVLVACDPDQHSWWLLAGESTVATPRSVTELIGVLDEAGAVLGNDSGPCHLAAFCGVPTFTLFGPQLPEWFAPLHPRAEWLPGKACPHKPCSDYCRFEVPFCMVNTSEAEVRRRVAAFLARVLPA